MITGLTRAVIYDNMSKHKYELVSDVVLRHGTIFNDFGGLNNTVK